MEKQIVKVDIWNRADCCGSRLNGAQVKVDSQLCGTLSASVGMQSVICNKRGSVVEIKMPRSDSLTLCEVKVYESRSDSCKEQVKNLQNTWRTGFGNDYKYDKCDWQPVIERLTDGYCLYKKYGPCLEGLCNPKIEIKYEYQGCLNCNDKSCQKQMLVTAGYDEAGMGQAQVMARILQAHLL